MKREREREYLNEYNPDHFTFPRTLHDRKALLETEPSIGVDGWVAILATILSMAALFVVWYTEGGL